MLEMREMTILCNNIVGICGNSAIHKLVIILIEVSKEMEAEINAESTAAAAAEARYRQIGKDLAFGSREEAESCLREKSAEAESMRAEIEKAARRSNEAVSHKHANDARISELENVVRGYEPVDEKKGLKWIHKATFQGYQPAIDYCKEHGYKWY